MPGLIIDLFAGGGGASEGIRRALGRDPDIAINHDPEAVAMHKANHPGTAHFIQNIWQVSPRWAVRGRRVDVLWASPDCTHFSKAKGAAPHRDSKRRDLAWIVEKWAREVFPRLIMMENVQEFLTWVPLIRKLDHDGNPVLDPKTGKPCMVPDASRVDKHGLGETFKRWARSLRALGYCVQWRMLKACDYGAPTSRTRLFIVARRDGLPIVWPKQSHGPGRAKPHRAAAECIDWSLPIRSIFDRPKPLAENTQRRIAEGIRRFVLEASEPFIIGIDQSGARSAVWSSEKPLSTVMTKGKHAVVVPSFVTYYGAKREGDFRGFGPLDLLRTQTTENRHALVAALLTKHYSGVIGQDLGQPLPTVTTVDHNAITAAHLVKLRGTCRHGQPLGDPAATITAGGQHVGLVAAHITRQFGKGVGSSPDAPLGSITAGGGGKSGLVYAFLTKYYGTAIGLPLCEPMSTATTKDRMGLVAVVIKGEPYVMTDICMRMLQPRELFRAQGFEDSYIIDPVLNGKPLTKTSQVRMCGNSVPPPFSEALARANYVATEEQERPALPLLEAGA